MLASTRSDNLIYALVLTSAATFALMSEASPAALACLTASPAASHCFTRASIGVAAVPTTGCCGVLLQPSFCTLAMQCSLSQTRARAARGTINGPLASIAGRVLRLAASLDRD